MTTQEFAKLLDAAFVGYKWNAVENCTEHEIRIYVDLPISARNVHWLFDQVPVGINVWIEHMGFWRFLFSKHRSWKTIT